MLVWGVASVALRDIITGFLDEVRFDYYSNWRS